jgi:hypothetical protein
VKPRKWLPILTAALALGALGYGAYAFLGDLRSAGDSSSGAALPQRPIMGGKKRPRDYKLPEYPTAYGFMSSDDGTSDRGSSAFSVRKGTAKAVTAFYLNTLLLAGWEFERSEVVKQRFGEKDDPKSVLLTGVRQYWGERNGYRKLTVLAMDLIKKGSTAQVVLSWSPALEGGGQNR